MNWASLTELLDEHLVIARAAPSGGSAHTVYGGDQRSLRQSLVALAAGRRLDDHDSPGEATLQVPHARVRLIAGDASCEGTASDVLVVPDARPALEALDDSGILLTISTR